MAKALIAMSGGVDSSVAALLCVREGLECAGVTMKLFSNEDAGIPREKTCCSLDDTEDARSVARSLGIPHYVFNFSDDFGETVMRRFACAYETGATPNPCIDCNKYMKFGKLLQRMRELEFDYVVTGHYARIERSGGRYLLKKALDSTKDQSYVLYMLTQDQLAHILFPLGGLRKTETRLIAEENGFVSAKKRESQDICFVPDGDYARFIERYTGKQYPRGRFVDTRGGTMGEHEGLICYTVGQRRGLGLSAPERLYVCAKHPDENEIVLGHESDLYSGSLEAEDFNWIACEAPAGTLRVRAKTRYRQKEFPAAVTVTGDGAVHVEFDTPQKAVAAGQAVVLYDGDTVIGGGTITETGRTRS